MFFAFKWPPPTRIRPLNYDHGRQTTAPYYAGGYGCQEIQTSWSAGPSLQNWPKAKTENFTCIRTNNKIELD